MRPCFDGRRVLIPMRPDPEVLVRLVHVIADLTHDVLLVMKKLLVLFVIAIRSREESHALPDSILLILVRLLAKLVERVAIAVAAIALKLWADNDLVGVGGNVVVNRVENGKVCLDVLEQLLVLLRVVEARILNNSSCDEKGIILSILCYTGGGAGGDTGGNRHDGRVCTGLQVPDIAA